jgi:hypothetical protein
MSNPPPPPSTPPPPPSLPADLTQTETLICLMRLSAGRWSAPEAINALMHTHPRHLHLLPKNRTYSPHEFWQAAHALNYAHPFPQTTTPPNH